MRGMNHVVLFGHIGHHPELRTTPNGRRVCDVRIATNRPVRQGDSWSEVTDWHQVVLWERDAERCARFIKKGDPLGIEGELRQERWTDASGQKRVKMKVHARRLHLLGKPRPETQSDGTQSVGLNEATAPAQVQADAASIPF